MLNLNLLRINLLDFHFNLEPNQAVLSRLVLNSPHQTFELIEKQTGYDLPVSGSKIMSRLTCPSFKPTN